MLTVVIERRDGTRSSPIHVTWHAPEAPLPGDIIEREHALWCVRSRRWFGAGDLTVFVEEFVRPGAIGAPP